MTLSQGFHFQSGALASVLMLLIGGGLANATTFEFELNVEGNVPGNNNDVNEFPGPNPQVAADFYGSNIAAETAAFITSDGTGATPDIGIVWGPDHDVRADVWEFHRGAFWSSVWADPNVPEFVVQIDVDNTPSGAGFPDDPTIEFVVPQGVQVEIIDFDLAVSNTSTRAPYAWTIDVVRSSDDAVVDTQTTIAIPVGSFVNVPINFIGDDGEDYYLRFDDGGEDHTSTALDNLSFRQIGAPIPEPTSLALIALVGVSSLSLRRRK